MPQIYNGFYASTRKKGTNKMTIKELTEKKEYSFDDIVGILRILRGEGGCEWDRAQTHKSIRANTIEEAYEIADAIDRGDIENLIEETGDLLLQSLFHIEIARDKGEFGYNEVYNRLAAKLISRHTHIFGTDKTNDAAEALKLWEKNKLAEKPLKTHFENLKSVPHSMAGLMRAYKIQDKAAKAGFDFETVDEVAEKVREEYNEVIDAIKTKNQESVEEELGDLLFAVVNLCRFFRVEPETALNKTSAKFIKRFEYVENGLSSKGKDFSDSTESNKLWEESKKV